MTVRKVAFSISSLSALGLMISLIVWLVTISQLHKKENGSGSDIDESISDLRQREHVMKMTSLSLLVAWIALGTPANVDIANLSYSSMRNMGLKR